jgi:hypothetical protein
MASVCAKVYTDDHYPANEWTAHDPYSAAYINSICSVERHATARDARQHCFISHVESTSPMLRRGTECVIQIM